MRTVFLLADGLLFLHCLSRPTVLYATRTAPCRRKKYQRLFRVIRVARIRQIANFPLIIFYARFRDQPTLRLGQTFRFSGGLKVRHVRRSRRTLSAPPALSICLHLYSRRNDTCLLFGIESRKK